jgi:hypothetical protein
MEFSRWLYATGDLVRCWQSVDGRLDNDVASPWLSDRHVFAGIPPVKNDTPLWLQCTTGVLVLGSVGRWVLMLPARLTRARGLPSGFTHTASTQKSEFALLYV